MSQPTALPLALKFSNRRMSADLDGTIWEHLKIIHEAEDGYCWWGWWRAENSTDLRIDHSDALNALVAKGPAEIGLFSRSLGRAYIATVSEVHTRNGLAIQSPERHRTPSYYRVEPYPAWFKITDIRRMDDVQITSDSETSPADSPYQIKMLETRFRELGEDRTTILWRDDDIVPALPTLTTTSGSRVLHLSDLHFGSSHVWSSLQRARPGKITQFQAVERTLRRHKISAEDVGVIVISGDISDHGPDKDRYAVARAFISDLLSLTGCDANNLVIVPGNHDVVRHYIDPHEDASFDYAEEQYDDRVREGEREYAEFCEQIFREPVAITRLRRFQLPDNELNFLQLNSTLPRDQFNKEYGFFGLEPLDLLQKMLDLRTATPSGHRLPVGIAVAHHHLLATTKAEYVPAPSADTAEPHDPVSTIVDQSNMIDWCTQYQVRLMLHGHQHKAKSRTISDRFSNQNSSSLFLTEVVGAGSAGAKWRGDEDDLSFNVYDFEGDKIRMRTLEMDTHLSNMPVKRDYYIRAEGVYSDE